MNFRVTDSGMTAFHAAVEGGKIEVLQVRELIYFVVMFRRDYLSIHRTMCLVNVN